MADVLLTTGDHFEHPMFIEDDKVPRNIAASSTIVAALVDIDGLVLIGSTSVIAGTPGSDWPSGKIVVVFTDTQTGAVNGAPTAARIVAKVTTAAGKPTTYFSDYFQVIAGI